MRVVGISMKMEAWEEMRLPKEAVQMESRRKTKPRIPTNVKDG